MTHHFLTIALLSILVVSAGNAFAGGSALETFFGQNHSSTELNRRGNGAPIRVTTKSMDQSVKTNATINRGLNSIGLPSLMGPPKVQRQSAWVPGRGFVDITDQAQRQVDAKFRQQSGKQSRVKR